MAIVKMNHFTLLTFEAHKQPLLKAMQKCRRVHFKHLQKEDFEASDIRRNVEQAAHLENELARITFAADKIKPFAALPTGLKKLTAPEIEMSFDELERYGAAYDYAAVCDRVQACDDRQKAAMSELNKLKTENDNLKQWIKMDIAPVELDRLRTVRCTIGAVNKNTAAAFVARLEAYYADVYIEMLQAVKDDVTFFVMAHADAWDEVTTELKTVGFTKSILNFTDIPAEKIEANLARIATLERTLQAIDAELATFADAYGPLRTAADYFQTALERARACENFMNLADVLIIDGWTPTADVPALKQMLDTVCKGEYYIEEAPVDHDDAEVPICLHNNRVVTAFEDITGMYSMPRYNEIDPTPLLAPFYMLFFAIMVGDAGYGLLLAVGTALALRFLHFGAGTRRFMQFIFYCGLTTFFVGLLFGGMFGVTVFKPLTDANGNPKAILDAQLDIVTMIVLSIAIGVVQVLFGIGVKGYMLVRDGKVLDAIFDALFWIVVLVSGILLIVGYAMTLPAAVSTVSTWCFVGGLLGLVATQGRANASVGAKIAGGLYAVYGITGYVGDLVSYTRLVALSLSGAYIAYSFNLMAGLVPNIVLRIIMGGLIVVAGQSINIGLAVLGAYVHSCRLQYVEFFGKFYEGGGVPFKPLAAKNAFVKIKEEDISHVQ